LAARAIVVYEATQLVEELKACRKLIVVDACRTDGPVGTITRLRWPDPRIAMRHNHSTHGVGVCGALQLAERLRRMPPSVEIFGLEVGDCAPGPEMSSDVLEAMFELEALIFSELREVIHA
jgi:hydrogenase maturation protease